MKPMVVDANQRSLPLEREEFHEIFPFLTADESEIFCSYLEVQEWPVDGVLMKDGDTGEFMGFLIDGRLAVKKETSFPGKQTLVAILERGSMVGEIAVVEPSPRNATVVAAEKSTLLILTREGLDRLLEENHKLGIKLLKRIIHVLGSRLRKASDRLALLL